MRKEKLTQHTIINFYLLYNSQHPHPLILLLLLLLLFLSLYSTLSPTNTCHQKHLPKGEKSYDKRISK